jgi:hypothetical protein
VFAGLGPLVSIGMLPGPSFGFAGSASVRWPSLSLGLEGSSQLPTSTDPKLAAGRRTSISLVYGSIVPCLHISRFVGCGIFSNGILTKVDLLPPRTTTYYGSVGGRLGYEYSFFPRLTLQGSGDVVVPFVWDSELKDRVTVWTTPSVGFAFGTRLIASF